MIQYTHSWLSLLRCLMFRPMRSYFLFSDHNWICIRPNVRSLASRHTIATNKNKTRLAVTRTAKKPTRLEASAPPTIPHVHAKCAADWKKLTDRIRMRWHVRGASARAFVAIRNALPVVSVCITISFCVFVEFMQVQFLPRAACASDRRGSSPVISPVYMNVMPSHIHTTPLWNIYNAQEPANVLQMCSIRNPLVNGLIMSSSECPLEIITRTHSGVRTLRFNLANVLGRRSPGRAFVDGQTGGSIKATRTFEPNTTAYERTCDDVIHFHMVRTRTELNHPHRCGWPNQ